MKKIYTILTACILLFSVGEGFAQTARQRMVGQIQLLVNEKASRTPAQKKMDSHLLQATREQRGQKMVTGVSLAPSRVQPDSKGLTEVDINADVSDELINKIEALGGRIILPSWEYHTIRAAIILSTAETIAGYPEVKFMKPAARATTSGSVINKTAGTSVNNNTDLLSTIDHDLRSTFSRPSSSVRTARVREQVQKYILNHPATAAMPSTVRVESDRVHRADEVRSTFGYEGQGIRIGIISDSYNKLGTAAADVAGGNLPGTGNPYGNTTPVTVVQDHASGNDEGRAMLQIVHDIAPKAQLFFATAEVSEAGFANNILALSNTYHCDIIIDDMSYYDESPFQDGPIAQAVNTVTAAGVLYFASAGNQGSVLGNTAGYFEGDFNDAGSPAFSAGSKTGTIHNFGGGINGNIITAAGSLYNLSWSDPLGNSNNDYDLFLVSANGTIKDFSTNIQNGAGKDPYEEIFTQKFVAGDRLVVFKATGASVRAFALLAYRGRLTVTTTGQTHGHSAAANAFSIAAAPAYGAIQAGAPTGPYPNAFSTGQHLEKFSSDGPRRIFYDANGKPVTPGNLLFSTNGGTTRNKPDFTAADGVSTTLPASGLNPFFGTSAAAPAAGAIAALLKSAKPSLTSNDIRTIFMNTALDIEGPGRDNNSGYGIIQAYQAMQAVNPTVILSSISTPAVGCPSNITVSNDAGQCGAIVNFTLPAVTNNYQGATVVASPASGSFFAKGTTTVTCTTTDASNNTSTCTFKVTVNDTELPVVTCPSNITVNTDPGKCTAVVNFTATATDNCPGVSVTYSPASGSIFPIGTTTVISTATDASGNQKTCSFTVTVNDTKPLIISRHPIDIIACVDQNAGAVVTAANPTSYQWQVNSGNGFTNIAGATGNVLPLSTVSPAMNGNLYRVVLGGLCSSLTSNAAKLMVAPIPTITLAAAPLSSLKPGEQTTIIATTTPATGGSLLWMRNNMILPTAVSRTLACITVDGIGTYKVMYTNVCTVSSADLVINATASDNLFMYPNPSNGRFQLRYYTPVNELLILTISDYKGAGVYRKQVTTSGPYTKIDVDISRNGAGVYAVELRNKDNKVVGIKQIILVH